MKDSHLISKITAVEIKDSRKNPTIMVTVFSGDESASFSVPSGASTGSHEAHELRDQDGRGVKNAIEKVNNAISSILVGKDVLNQKEIDRIMIELDGTSNKTVLGGNSMIGVSIACVKLAAKVSGVEVYHHLRTLIEIKPSRKTPYLYMNLINGGKHAKNGLAFQEYHIVPMTENIGEAIELGIKIQNSLKDILAGELGSESLVLGDEGGFAPAITDIKMPLIYLNDAIKKNSSNDLPDRARLALDVAATSFYEPGSSAGRNGIYKIDGKNFSKEDLMKMYESLMEDSSLFSIEDPFYEEDFESFKKLKDSNKGLVVVGDDLTVTNKSRLREAISQQSIGAIIIKPNQIGTLSETLETMKLARENNIELIVSHRSGETNDDFIADLAYAFGCFGFKSGAPLKPERMIKYNRLKKIAAANL